MSISTIGSSDSQNIGSLVLQSLLGSSTSSTDSNGLSGILGDLMTLSPASQQLAQAPAAVTSAMTDLFSTQKNVSGDLSALTAYFKDNPTTLTNVMSALEGGASTYSSSGSTSSSALVNALAQAQAGGTDTSTLLSSLLGGSSTDPLLEGLGSSSSSSVLSMLG